MVDHVIDYSLAMGQEVIYWHDSEGTFTHPASGMRYHPESNVSYNVVSTDLDD